MEFSPLTDDNDLLMIGEDTFTVSRLKDLMEKGFQDRYSFTNIARVFHENYLNSPISIVTHILDINLAEINMNITTEEIQHCKLLCSGNSNWQHGKIKIIANLQIEKEDEGNEITDGSPKKKWSSSYNIGKTSKQLTFSTQIELLFCPEDLSNNESNES
jgi:hypothetical protein